MKREAAERRSRGNAWSGYSLETVDFKKKAIGSGPVDESVYHKRGAYMGRHWRKNKARQRPQDNRARFVKSLTSHGLRSSGTRKEARNATVRHHGPSFGDANSPLKGKKRLLLVCDRRCLSNPLLPHHFTKAHLQMQHMKLRPLLCHQKRTA